MNICIGLYNAFCAKKLNITDILLELTIKRIRKVNYFGKSIDFKEINRIQLLEMVYYS